MDNNKKAWITERSHGEEQEVMEDGKKSWRTAKSHGEQQEVMENTEVHLSCSRLFREIHLIFVLPTIGKSLPLLNKFDYR